MSSIHKEAQSGGEAEQSGHTGQGKETGLAETSEDPGAGGVTEKHAKGSR